MSIEKKVNRAVAGRKIKWGVGTVLQICAAVVFLYALWFTDIVRGPFLASLAAGTSVMVTLNLALALSIFFVLTLILAFIHLGFRQGSDHKMRRIILCFVVVAQLVTTCVWTVGNTDGVAGLGGMLTFAAILAVPHLILLIPSAIILRVKKRDGENLSQLKDRITKLSKAEEEALRKQRQAYANELEDTAQKAAELCKNNVNTCKQARLKPKYECAGLRVDVRNVLNAASLNMMKLETAVQELS